MFDVHRQTSPVAVRRALEHVVDRGAMASPLSPEEAVRRYLVHLEDPSQLVDQDKIAAAQAAVERAKDPLARLKALADLEHARQPDTGDVENDFVANAKAYADAESIPVAAFREMGVPVDVLARAGFPVRPRRASGTTATGAPRQRAPRVSLDTIKAAAVRLPRQFTLNDLAEKAGGGSQGTLRKAVEDLMAEGKVKKVGPIPNYRGRGRAPILYEQG
jgi:hypothetical protein